MKQFIFISKETVHKNGKVKKGRKYKIKTDDNGVVPLHMINMLREEMGKQPLKEGEGAEDRLDVSGARSNSPSMIVWNGMDFIAVPYDERYDRFVLQERIKERRKELEGSIQVNDLAAHYRISTKIVISVCQKSGLGEKQEHAPLTKEEVATISQKLNEISETFGDNRTGNDVKVEWTDGDDKVPRWV